MKRQSHGGAWRTTAALGGLALLAAAAAAQTQVYKWKDAHGRVHYGDTLPPQGAQVLDTSGRAPIDPALPYELARAVRLYPVTLYSTAHCAPCDQGRSLLRARGIPFTEKTVETLDDQQEQRRQTGKDALPLLVVGSRQMAGFQAAGWQEALDSASYPKQKMLPPGYQYAPPQPAAPSGTAPAPAAPSGPVRARIKVPPDASTVQAPPAATTPSDF